MIARNGGVVLNVEVDLPLDFAGLHPTQTLHGVCAQMFDDDFQVSSLLPLQLAGDIAVRGIRSFERAGPVEVEEIDDCLTRLDHFLLHAGFQRVELRLDEQFLGHFFERVEKFQACALGHALLTGA